MKQLASCSGIDLSLIFCIKNLVDFYPILFYYYKGSPNSRRPIKESFEQPKFVKEVNI